jgi:hypothetical protein
MVRVLLNDSGITLRWAVLRYIGGADVTNGDVNAIQRIVKSIFTAISSNFDPSPRHDTLCGSAKQTDVQKGRGVRCGSLPMGTILSRFRYN